MALALSRRGRTIFRRFPMAAVTASRRCFASAATPREPSTEAQFPTPRLQTKLFINNEFVDAEGGRTFPSVNPGNGEKLADVAHGQGLMDWRIHGNLELNLLPSSPLQCSFAFAFVFS